MKFYRMKNDDVVTDLHISTKRANALKGTRMYDAGNKTLCCDERIYYDGVASRLSSAATAVLLNQIDGQLKGCSNSKPEQRQKLTEDGGFEWLDRLRSIFP